MEGEGSSWSRPSSDWVPCHMDLKQRREEENNLKQRELVKACFTLAGLKEKPERDESLKCPLSCSLLALFSLYREVYFMYTGQGARVPRHFQDSGLVQHRLTKYDHNPLPLSRCVHCSHKLLPFCPIIMTFRSVCFAKNVDRGKRTE